MKLPYPVTDSYEQKIASLLHLKQKKKASGTDVWGFFPFIQKLGCLPALWIYGKESSRALCCMLPFTLKWQRKSDRLGITPLKYAKSFSKSSGTRGNKSTLRRKQPQQEETHFWQKNPKSLFKNKTQTQSYMNTYLLQVALWKAKSDKYKHYTELQASLPKPQTRCVLQRKQHNNIYNGRQSQINQLNFKTDLWSRNSKYNEQFQPYMF